jgi:hypothetical protein
VFGNNPDLHAMSVVSQAFGNQPEVFRHADPIVSSSLMKMGLSERGQAVSSKGPDVQIIGNGKYERQSFDVIKGGIANLLDGNLDAKAKKDVRTEVFGQMKGVMEQYADQFQLGKLNSDSRKRMNEFLLDKDTARFLKENPLPSDVARGLAAAAEDNFKQYEKVFNEATSGTVLGAQIKAPVSDATRGRGRSYTPGTRTPSVQAIDSVDVTWQGDKLVFTPKDMPVDRIDQNRLVSELNKISNVLSNGIKIGAHIQGEDNYQKYYDSIKHHLFPSKFDEPIDKQDKTIQPTTTDGSYSKESNLKNIVANTPLEQTQGRRMEPPAEVNIKSIRDELRKATTKEQIDALLEALDYEMNKRGK